jgi:very-short-patch-repair endonuclease
MDADRRLAEITSAQRGLVTAQQALTEGITRRMLQHRVARGVLIRAEPGVYRMAGAPESWEQRVQAATFAEGGFASHRTAAALWGLDGCRPGVIEVTTERWRRRPNSSVRLHETTSLPEEDRATVRGIDVTSIPRTIVDIAAVLPRERVEQALDTHGVDPARVLECAERLFSRGRPWVAVPRRLSAARVGRDGVTPNLFESLLFGILRRAGLPLPTPQVEVRRPDGSLIGRVDWLIEPFHIVLECDSFAFHGQWIRRKADLRRDRQLVALGYRVLRFSWEDLTDYESVVVHDVTGAISAVSA